MKNHYRKLVAGTFLSVCLSAQFNSQAMGGYAARLFAGIRGRRMALAATLAGSAAAVKEGITLGQTETRENGYSENSINFPEGFEPSELVFNTNQLFLHVDKPGAVADRVDLRGQTTSAHFDNCSVEVEEGEKPSVSRLAQWKAWLFRKNIPTEEASPSFRTIVRFPITWGKCEFKQNRYASDGDESIGFKCDGSLRGYVASYAPKNTTVTFNGLINGKKHSLLHHLLQAPVASIPQPVAAFDDSMEHAAIG